ncbi:MAG: RNA methyltransferase [Bacilli bacterium]|nr:RNA methyltransferase [Bacilli bacterium]
MYYESINNKKIKFLNQLKLKKYRDREGMFLVETENLVKEAYNNGYLKELYVREGININLDVETHYISDNVVKYLSDVKSSTGIFGLCNMKKMNLKEGRILVLDSVQDPGNMGTIIRSACAFNIDTIVINDKCADIYSSKVVRSSEGMIFNMNIIKCDLVDFINNIKKSHKVYGTNVNGGKSLKNVKKNEKFVIIVGNEGNGVSDILLNLADEFLYIPISGKCESLNVSVATGIILYELGGE